MAILIDNIQKKIISSYVNCHNLTNILGWFFLKLPFGNPAYKANLEVVFIGGLSVSVFYLAIYFLFGSRLTAAITASFLLVSHSMWWNSTIVEVYAMNALFTAVGALFFARILKKHNLIDYLLLSFFAGLSIFNHVATGFFCVGWAACLAIDLFQRRVKKNDILKIFSAFGLGLLPWFSVFTLDWYRIGDFEATLKQAFLGPFSGLMFAGSLLKNFIGYLIILINQFPNGYFVLGFMGLFLIWKKYSLRGPVLGLTLFFLLNTIFFINYETWNRFCHLLPSIVLLVFFGSFVVNPIVKWVTIQRRLWVPWVFRLVVMVGIIYPIYFFSMLTTWGQDVKSIWFPKYANLSTPCFRTNEFIANPNKRNFTDYQDYVDALFNSLPQGAIYVDDDGRGYYTVSDYNQKLLGRRPDINVVMTNSFGIDNAGWGEDPRGLAQLIARSYFDNRQFFMISMEWPMSRALQKLPGSERFVWEQFAVGSKCRIFRLKTKNENPDSLLYRPDLIRFLAEPIIVKQKKMHTYNLSMANVNLVQRASVVMQDMSGYGTAWMRDDQLFVRGEGPRSWVEFILESPVESTGTMTFSFTTSYDYGVVDIFLNEERIASSVDLFTSSVWVKKVSADQVKFKKGSNHLLFQFAGKNPRSTGYVLGIDTVRAVIN